MVFENFGDRPFFKDHVPPETVAAPDFILRHEDGARIWRPLAQRTWAPDPEPSSRLRINVGATAMDEAQAAKDLRQRGLAEANAASFAAADGAIAGTSIKRDGRVDAARVARLVAAFRAGGGR